MSDPEQPEESSSADRGGSGRGAPPPTAPGWGAPPPEAPAHTPQAGPGHLYGPPPDHEPTRPLEDPGGVEPTRELGPPPGPARHHPPPPGAWTPSSAQPPWPGQPPAPGQPWGYGQPYGPGYGTFGPVTNQKAAWALGTGLTSLLLVTCCFPLLGLGGIAGIVLGAQARTEIAYSGGRQSGEGLAIAGFVLGIVAVVAAVGSSVLLGIFYLLPLSS